MCRRVYCNRFAGSFSLPLVFVYSKRLFYKIVWQEHEVNQWQQITPDGENGEQCHKTRQQQIKYVCLTILCCVADDDGAPTAFSTSTSTLLHAFGFFILFELNCITILNVELVSYISSMLFACLLLVSCERKTILFVVTHFYHSPTASCRYFEHVLLLFQIKCEKMKRAKRWRSRHAAVCRIRQAKVIRNRILLFSLYSV